MAGGSAPYCILFNDSATTELYTLSLHDALPISEQDRAEKQKGQSDAIDQLETAQPQGDRGKVQHERRSEEHTSELQSRRELVCRLLLEKKKSEVMSKGKKHSDARRGRPQPLRGT